MSQWCRPQAPRRSGEERLHCGVSYCEYRTDLKAGESEQSFGLKPSGDSVEWSGFPERMMASVFRQPVSNLWRPSVSFRTRQAKVWWTESRMWKALKGNTNPWEYRLGSLQQCMGPRRTRQWSNALKSRPLRGERFSSEEHSMCEGQRQEGQGAEVILSGC